MMLPLLPLPHDWTDPVRRTVRYPVSVLPRRDGSEQRVLRATVPAETVTYRVVPFRTEDAGRVRAFLWAAGGNVGNLRCRVPRWEDAVRLMADVAEGAAELPVESGALADRAFVQGGEVLLWRPLPGGAHAWEVATILALAADTITLFAGTAAAWGAGTTLVPVSVGRLSPDVDLQRLHPPYAVATLAYELDARDLAGVGPVGGTGGVEAVGVPATLTLRRPTATALATAGDADAPGWAVVEALVRDATGLVLAEQAITWSVASSIGTTSAEVTPTPDAHVAVVRAALSGASGSVTVQAALGDLTATLVVTFD